MAINQSFSTDSSGSQLIVGEGVAGTPTGGLLTIQGTTNGTPVPVIDPLDSISSVINITTQDIASTTTVGFANQSLITGTPTAGSAASYTLSSIQTVMVLIKGTWTGTLSIEVSEDSGTTWEPRGIHVIGTSTFASNITANVAGSMNGTGKTNMRVRATAAMTGTANINILISDNVSNIYIANSIKLVDGSSTPNVNMLTIKAGSTSALTTDTAAVVAISPATGINTLLDKSGTGTITALNGTVIATTNGASTVLVNIMGTWVATLLFEGQDGNGNWIGILGVVPGNGNPVSGTTTNLTLAIPSGGFNQVRIRASLFTSGTVTVNYNVGAGLQALQVFNLIASGLQTTARLNDGSGNSILSINNQLETRDVLNTSSQYRAQSITTTAGEALGAGTILVNRKFLHITPTNGIIYWGYSNTVTTATGTPIFPNNTLFLSVTDNIHVYLISAVTTDARIGEVS